MKRRNFVTTAGAAALASNAAPAAAKNSYYEMLHVCMRTGDQVKRTTDFFAKHFLPVWRRLNFGPTGFFNAVIAEQSPFLLALLSYPNLASLESTRQMMADDKEFQKGLQDFNSHDLNYIRIDNSLLRAFDGMPNIAVPAQESKREPRIFELRTYESNNSMASKRKIKMFNDGEIQIFQRLGMSPVFFGETIVGRNLPNLVYMLAFDDLASRERLWKAFGADPEWQKMRSQPDLADALIVSNISNSILRPLPFSHIK